MVKNILKIGIVLLLMFSVASLAACETFNLNENKIESKSELDIYVESKSNEIFNNGETIIEIATNNKHAIDEETSKTGVDVILFQLVLNIMIKAIEHQKQ